MVSDWVTHQTIHLSNPNINYVKLENCKFCKLERIKKFDSQTRVINRQINSQIINIDNELIDIDADEALINYNDITLQYFDNPIFEENVYIFTPLEKINKSSTLLLNQKINFCSICQDSINKNSICRKITCGHIFHYECIDKWLETNRKCPTCRFEI